MKKNLFRTACIAVVMALSLLLLAGCGKGGETQSGYVYVPEYIDLPEDISSVNYACYSEDTVYFCAYGKSGERTPEPGEPQPGEAGYYEGMYDLYGSTLYKMGSDGSGFARLSDYTAPSVPAGVDGYADVSGITVDAAGRLWVMESYTYYTVNENGDQSDGRIEIILRQLDDTGAELQRFDLTALADGAEYFHISYLLAGQDGYLYTSDGQNTVYAIDSNTGQKAFSLEVDDWINGIYLLSDGTVAAQIYGGEGVVLKPVNSASRTWGEDILLTNHANNIYNGAAGYDIYYSDNSDLYGFRTNGNVEEKLLNWIESDLSGGVANLFPLTGDRFLGITYDYNNGGTDFVLLTKTDRSQLKPQTTLTLACLYMDYDVRAQVVEFNKSNSEYRIQVKDYSQYNSDDDYSAGLMKLNTEILSGQVPDIILVDSELPINQYAAKGLLENLYPYIEADSSLGGREALVEPFFDAVAVGDVLPYIASSFTISTTMGASRVVGEEPGWTIDELTAALAQMPQGCQAFANMSRTDVLMTLLNNSIDSYVDWDSGECRFDGADFAQLLEFCQTFPESIDYENWENLPTEEELIKQGLVLLIQSHISSFDDLAWQKSYFGEDYTLKGYPCESGSGSSFIANSGLAISAKCAHKDVAWDFISYLLDPTYQKENSFYGLPTNRAALQQMIDDTLQNADEYGVAAASASDLVDISAEQFRVTQEDIDKVLYLIEHTDNVMSYNSAITNIVVEESSAFFAGQKSADDTARIIQDRVRTYISEQS